MLVVPVSGLYRFFVGGPDSLLVDDRSVRFGDAQESAISLLDLSELRLSTGLIWSSVTFSDRHGTVLRVGGLSNHHAQAVCAAAEGALASEVSSTEELLRSMAGDLTGLLSGARYARSSFSEELRSRVLDALARITQKPLVVSLLSEDSRGLLESLRGLNDQQQFDVDRAAANGRYVATEAAVAVKLSSEIGGRQLNQEQSEAVATGEDCTLVLAGAGTGKTATIVAKVAHLLLREHVLATDILVLAFNRKAVEEIEERLVAVEHSAGGAFSKVRVSTFNALGSRAIGQLTGRKPSVAKVAEDDQALLAFLQRSLNALLADRASRLLVEEFLAYYLIPVAQVSEYSTLGEYYQGLARTDLRTIQGERVRSGEELRIANFLWLHEVPYRYEDPYTVDTGSARFSQYHPDFHVIAELKRDEGGSDQTRPGVWLEHFALNRDGTSPFGERYLEGVRWKRAQHQQFGTNLLETYSWQVTDGSFEASLRTQLERLGITLRRRTETEWIRPQQITRLAVLVAGFLNAYKSGNWSSDALQDQLQTQSDSGRARAFLVIFEKLLQMYADHLAAAREVDFHDQINEAAKLLEMRPGALGYREVLVDEFQDISASRLRLLRALRGGDTRYFLVGDDWQSIYRFAGSDVGLVSKVHEHLGFTERRFLRQTFRFGGEILEPMSAFVRTNPNQSQRDLVPAPGVEDDGITVVGTTDHASGIQFALAEISKKSLTKRPLSILVLGRYRDAKKQLELAQGQKIAEFITVHAAKGREADYVVVLNLENSVRGFPSQQADDPLLRMILPEAETFSFAEERRLFYVAVTRARRGAYLVTNSSRPSGFVTELVSLAPRVRSLGELWSGSANPCPQCESGMLVASQSRRTHRCSNYPYCDYLAPLCSVCGVGYVTVKHRYVRCTTPGCDGPEACPSPECDQGILVRREGARGGFWGCSRFNSVPPCRYTRDAAAGESAPALNALARQPGRVSSRSTGGDHNDLLIEALKDWRQERVQVDGLAPHNILSDRSLDDLVRIRPSTRSELAAVYGLGAARVDRWGDDLLQLIREHPR